MSKEDEKIGKLLDDEFLKKLVEIARIYGWSGDYMENWSIYNVST